MRRLNRYEQLLYGLSSGAITLGILQGLGGIQFGNIFTTFLLELLSAIVTLLFGGNLSLLFNRFYATA